MQIDGCTSGFCNCLEPAIDSNLMASDSASGDSDFSDAFSAPAKTDAPAQPPAEQQPGEVPSAPPQQPAAAPTSAHQGSPQDNSGFQPGMAPAQPQANVAPQQPTPQAPSASPPELTDFSNLSLADPNETIAAPAAAQPSGQPAAQQNVPQQPPPQQPSAPEQQAAPQAPAPQQAAPQAPAPQPAPQNQPQPEAPASPSPDNVAVDKDGDGVPKAPTGSKPMRIGERLIAMGLISDDQLQVALQEQKSSRKLLGATLVDLGFITESTLAEVLAESAGAERFDPKSAVLDTALIRKIPKDVATRHKVIAAELNQNRLILAMADVYNVLALDQVRRYFPKQIQMIPVYCTESEILELIDQYYDYEMSIDGILEEIETGIRNNKDVLDGQQEGYVNPTVRLVNAILVDAIKLGASDIHFEPEGSFLRLRYRIDGIMRQVRSFHKDYWSAMSVRIKIMSGMNIAESRNPQDGRITYNVMGREVDFRVATHPTVHGENIVMRLLDKAKSLVRLEHLGFSEHNIRLLKKLLKRPEGIVIVTGPTGSGKTTTLYSVLSYINSMDVNIMTLEDPVEYQLPLIRQTHVRENTGADFVSGIRSLMRQDPDIIFIGEVRDEDTALMAVRAALTGHQVYTTLHTNDAMGAIPRLMDIGVPSHLLSGTLICTLAQRLARKLCEKCRKPRLATPEECQILGFDADDAPTIYEPAGCDACNNTGYKGRTAILEIMPIDREMDELIAKGATRNSMMEACLESGFVRMIDDGIAKVVSGVTDLNELISTIDMTERL